MEAKKQVEQRLNFLVKNVYFDTDKSDIRVESYPSLVELATILNQNPELSFYVDGHTDSTGGAEFNQKLSEKRANEIKNFLENNLGVSKTQLEARGFGDTVPVAKNNDAQRRQLNRRVEIKIKG
jgi:outer membrane protein OmpA-like peptidoglycan-associated protein